MKGLVLCNKGIEEICSNELKEFGASNIELGNNLVLFELSDEKKLCEIVYSSQSIKKAILLLDSFTFKDKNKYF